MKYTIEIQHENLETDYHPGNTKRQAIKLARQTAKENPKALVFVSWLRPSDGQRGFLNRDGHAIVGSAW